MKPHSTSLSKCIDEEILVASLEIRKSSERMQSLISMKREFSFAERRENVDDVISR